MGTHTLWVKVSTLSLSKRGMLLLIGKGGPLQKFGELGVSRLKGKLKSTQMSLAGSFTFFWRSAVLTISPEPGSHLSLFSLSSI